MAGSHTRFKYRPLEGPDSIRVLRIVPSEDIADESIHIVIDHVSFESAPPYEALSYCWGPATPSRTVRCCGASLDVRENLYQALEYLRIRGTGFLWVDSLCINQEDALEKSEQVRLMHSIFNRAKNVLSWLGQDRAVALNHIGDPQLLPVTDLIEFQETVICELLSNNYWTRAWTLQELVLSERSSIVLCRCEIGWHEFLTIISSYAQRLEKIAAKPQLQQALRFISLVSSIGTLKRLLKAPNMAKTDPTLSSPAWAEFYRVTNFAKGLHATDPRDKIYSWIGLATALGFDILSPDYTKPVYVVLKDTKLAMWEQCVEYGAKGRNPDVVALSKAGKAQRDSVSPDTRSQVNVRPSVFRSQRNNSVSRSSSYGAGLQLPC